MELLQTLGIDLKLLVFQIINFGILVYLLSRFVYKPLVRRIEDDEKRLKAADKAQKELEAKKVEYEKQHDAQEFALQEKTRQLVAESEDIAQRIVKEAHEQAKADADRIVKNAANLKELQSKAEIDRLKEDTSREVKAKMRDWATVVLGDEALQAKLADYYKDKLETLLKHLPINSAENEGGVTLFTGRSLRKEEEKAVAKIVSTICDKEVGLSVVVDEELICGFRFEGFGYRVDANLQYDIEKL
ncbi:hypothetical protein KC614_01085 [candidate division WWE3 bacterium]|uniref:ATP synthase subunit b n=1 Tax=candidate division WWE3 bacterium TaxID=2053526 RepID=A0A955LKC6_UNCKA|nr:hypothetical protein [candidate division WWE3 bacterium]